MPYFFDSRIRYSEVDEGQRLTLPELVDYYQDCSTFQSEDGGVGLNFLKERHRAWMIIYWQIEIDRLPRLGERVRIQTWPYAFKGFFGLRNFSMLDENGDFLSRANSVWVMMDTQTGKPCKVEQEEISGYSLEPKLEQMEYLPRKITLPEKMEERTPFPVLRQYLDTNHHVNNGQYIHLAQDYLPDDFPVKRLCVEYRAQAKLHDVIVPWIFRQEKLCMVALCSMEKEPYAVIRFEA